MPTDKLCYVCGGTATEDDGLDIPDLGWFCSSGCWCDYYIGKASLKEIDRKAREDFSKNISDK